MHQLVKLLSVLCLLFISISTPLMLSQTRVPRRYSFYDTATVTGASATTVQQPAASAKHVIFKVVWVYCDAACTPSLRRDGTAASKTAGIPVAASPNIAAPTVTGFTGSDVGDGTLIYPVPIAAGADKTLDLAGFEMAGDGTSKNLSLKFAAFTGTYKVLWVWEEE